MEVALVGKDTLKIKGKKASLIVDPKGEIPKTPADAILLLNGEVDPTRVEEYRVIINDEGEYEVGAIKITGISHGIYNLNVDNTQAILGKTSSIGKLSDTSNEAQVAILNVDSELNEAIIASLEAKVVILYGEKANEGLKALGKHDLAATKKFNVAKELSEDSETQIVWLD